MNLGSMNLNIASPLGSSAPQSPAETADMCASLDLLFQSATKVLAEDPAGMAMDVDTPGHPAGAGAHTHEPEGEPQPVKLDDVLDAAFLDDSAPEAGGSGSGQEAAPRVGGAGAGTGAESAADAQRWELMSVGAYRQTREAGGAGAWGDARHTPGGSADFGSALRPAPIGAMLWQQGGRVGGGGGGGGGSSAVRGMKHAKRRQMMLGAAGMASPLVLPSSGGSAGASPAMTPREKEKHLQTQTPGAGGSGSGHQNNHNGHNNNNNNNNQQNQEQAQKSRRELRRERKVQKKALKAHGAPPAVHAHAHAHAHQFHGHHHHPNAKLRGAGAVQRTNFFGGAVVPLNL